MSTAVLDLDLRVGSDSSSVSGAASENQSARIHLFWEAVPGWRLKNPLPIHVERDTDGRLVVSDEIFNVYGVGGSWDDAIGDYKVALVEFFEIASAAHDAESRRLV